MQTAPSPPGTLVVSLDFELFWGVHHRPDPSDYAANLVGARKAVPRLLDLFTRHGVAATWATVGFLFASDPTELADYLPDDRPSYRDARFDAYARLASPDVLSECRYAPELIARIVDTPNQEVASHSLSHLFCLEGGITPDDIASDAQAARRLGADRGYRLTSFVFPRNQYDEPALRAINHAGFTAFRGATPGWMHRPTAVADDSLPRRGARLLDAYLPLAGSHTFEQGWEQHVERRTAQPVNVPGSFFLRPASTVKAARTLQRRRIAASLRYAARAGHMVHVWWHPHNFGSRLEANLVALGDLLEIYMQCRERFGMRSLTMREAATHAPFRP